MMGDNDNNNNRNNDNADENNSRSNDIGEIILMIITIGEIALNDICNNDVYSNMFLKIYLLNRLMGKYGKWMNKVVFDESGQSYMVK